MTKPRKRVYYKIFWPGRYSDSYRDRTFYSSKPWPVEKRKCGMVVYRCSAYSVDDAIGSGEWVYRDSDQF